MRNPDFGLSGSIDFQMLLGCTKGLDRATCISHMFGAQHRCEKEERLAFVGRATEQDSTHAVVAQQTLERCTQDFWVDKAFALNCCSAASVARLLWIKASDNASSIERVQSYR